MKKGNKGSLFREDPKKDIRRSNKKYILNKKEEHNRKY